MVKNVDGGCSVGGGGYRVWFWVIFILEVSVVLFVNFVLGWWGCGSFEKWVVCCY